MEDKNKAGQTGMEDRMELRSEEVQEILTRPPHALVRWGISVICAVVFMLFAGSFFFRYPDIVSGEIILTTDNPPVWIVARSSGRIKELYCKDKQQVKGEELLAVVDNTANTRDIEELEKYLLQGVISDTALYFPKEIFNHTYSLGDIQNAYSAFSRAATDYENFLSLNLTRQERTALHAQIKDRKNYSSSLAKQLELKKREVEIARENFARETELYNKGINSKADMEIAEQNYLAIRQSYQQMYTGIASDKMETRQLEETDSRLSIQYGQDQKKLFAYLCSSYSELLASIGNWEQMYLLRATSNGTVTFNNFWKQDQFVKTGEKVFAVIPNNAGKLIGKAKFASSGSGKVKPSQRVNIRLSGYPYMQYGLLEGKVTNISFVANEDYYIADVILPGGLQTTTGEILQFTGELAGQAEIVTEDISLAQRILAPMKYILKKYMANENP